MREWAKVALNVTESKSKRSATSYKIWRSRRLQVSFGAIFAANRQRFDLLPGILSFPFHSSYCVETEHRDASAVHVCAAACYK